MSDPTELDHFHLFSSLPKELRDRIWELAWPSPGIHFFRIFDPWRHRMTNQIMYGPTWDYNCSLGAPFIPSLNEVAWLNGNPSAYVVHNMLLRTCRESREAALRLWSQRQGKWESIGAGVPAEDGEDSDDLDSEHVFLFQPAHDLVCLQFQDFEKFPVSMVDFFNSDYTGSGFDIPQLADVQRVAVPYREEWDEGLSPWNGGSSDLAADELLVGIAPEPHHRLPQLADLSRIPCHFSEITAFYLIDYTIKRRPVDSARKPKTGAGEAPEVFYAAGMRFCEVTPDDKRWEVTSEVFELISWLHERYPLSFANLNSPPPLGPPSFKVLACVSG